MKESWNEKNARLDAERDMRQAQRAHNPGMKLKLQKKIVTDDIFGLMWLGTKLKALKKKMKKARIIFLMLIPLLVGACTVTSAKKVGPNGIVSSFYSGAVGGKGGAVQRTGTNGEDVIAVFYDNEKSFRDGVIGLATYGVATVIGSAVEAGYVADTARHAATAKAGVINAQTAAEVAKTGQITGLIKDVGIAGEVPIATIALP